MPKPHRYESKSCHFPSFRPDLCLCTAACSRDEGIPFHMNNSEEEAVWLMAFQLLCIFHPGGFQTWYNYISRCALSYCFKQK